MTKKEYELDVGVRIWNILAFIFFVILCLVMYYVFLISKQGQVHVNVFDIVILSLANFRLIRLFIYDNMTHFIREMFMDLEVSEGVYKFNLSDNSFKLTMYKLMTCPWCFGMWCAFVSTFFYFTFPITKVIFIILAISAIASFLMILMNLIGWQAEAKRLEASKH